MLPGIANLAFLPTSVAWSNQSTWPNGHVNDALAALAPARARSARHPSWLHFSSLLPVWNLKLLQRQSRLEVRNKEFHDIQLRWIVDDWLINPCTSPVLDEKGLYSMTTSPAVVLTWSKACHRQVSLETIIGHWRIYPSSSLSRQSHEDLIEVFWPFDSKNRPEPQDCGLCQADWGILRPRLLTKVQALHQGHCFGLTSSWFCQFTPTHPKTSHQPSHVWS